MRRKRERILASAQLCFALDVKGEGRGEILWRKGLVRLTDRILWFKDEGGTEAIPLGSIARVKKSTFSPRHRAKPRPMLMLEYLRRAKNLGEVKGIAILTGAKTLVEAMEQHLTPVIRDEMYEGPGKITGEDFKLLSLIYLGITDIDLLSHLTSKNTQALMEQLRNLFAHGWLDEKGRLTKIGIGLIERILEGAIEREI